MFQMTVFVPRHSLMARWVPCYAWFRGQDDDDNNDDDNDDDDDDDGNDRQAKH